MAGLIAKDFIQDLIARADIVSVVESRVPLKKTGKNYQACCPFHNEKTPSFSVEPSKQFYYCFGCGAGGSALDFIMEYDGLEFPDAVEELAAMVGVEVQREERPGGGHRPERDRQQIEDDYQLMNRCARFFARQLRVNPNREQVIEYLKGRGLSGEVVQEYGIGYAPDAWDAVLQEFGRSKPQQQQLLALKLISENDNGRRFDFFRNRIMFPIRDQRGRVVGFGGRVMGQDSGPKYLNSPETRLFHKGQELYGFYELKQRERKPQQILIVEGYMDVVALAQHGVGNAVASLGTAATTDHLRRLFRHTDQVVCCFDGDQAGRGAAWRALENALPLLRDGKDMRFLFLPEGEDPDSLVQQHGRAGLEAQLAEAQSLRDYFFDRLRSQYDLSTDAGKAGLLQEAGPLIQQVGSAFYQDLLTETLARELGRTPEQLQGLLQETNQPRSRSKESGKAPENRALTPIVRAMGLLIQNPWLGRTIEVHEELAQLNMGGAKTFISLHRQCAAAELTTAGLLESWRDTPQESKLRRLAAWHHQVLPENIEREFLETYMFLINRYLEQRYEELKTLPEQQMTPAIMRELDQLVKALKGAL